MYLAHRLRALRPAGGGSMRVLLALAMLAGAFTLTVAGAEPASAETIQRTPTSVVITSERLHSVTVRTTQIITLNSNGNVTYRIEAHNGGRTRKYFTTDGWVRSPAGSLDLPFGSAGCYRIAGDDWRNYESVSFNPQVAIRWNDIVNDPDLDSYFHLSAYRVDACSISPPPG
jgi:hypothetical protein